MSFEMQELKSNLQAEAENMQNLYAELDVLNEEVEELEIFESEDMEIHKELDKIINYCHEIAGILSQAKYIQGK